MNQAPTSYTAGAVPVRNQKGEMSMKKVKVQRYISGKRPEYAQYESSDDESEDEDFVHGTKLREEAEQQYQYDDQAENEYDDGQDDYDDPRLRRLMDKNDDDYEEDIRQRHRAIHEPEVLSEESESESEEEVRRSVSGSPRNQQRTRRISLDRSETESDEELSDSEIERRRQMLRQKALQKQQNEELLVKEEEKQSENSESESSEYETEDESEGENEPRLKPLFVRKRDRTTVIEKEREAVKQRQLEHEAKRQAKERRRQTLRLVEESVKKELEQMKAEKDPNIGDVNTDDENDEVEYEAWKLRELKRIKRDREEKEQREKEKMEIERMRNLTEEERRQELRLNPKQVTNKAVKGKYKFLQKYYHRGAFYLDEEQQVFRQDFSAPTLEDHFDKTILPKVMQVKNFGRCGRTKYTHLVDQDTTKFDSPWFMESTVNTKFHAEKAGGMKQQFEKPSLYKRQKTS